MANLEEHKAALAAWRKLSHDEQLAKIGERLPDREADPANGRVKWGIVCPGLHNGGTEAWQEALVKAVGQAVSWQGLCLLGNGNRPTEIGKIMPISQGRSQAIALAQRCDAVLTWSPTPFLIGHTKVVYVSHLPVGELPRADAYVAVSELAVRQDNTPVIWNGIDQSRLTVKVSREVMRSFWGVPPGAKVAGYLGRLSSEKNPLAMVELARSLPEPWHVVVVGDGQMKLPPTDRLHPVGPDNHPGNAYNAFDVLVVPSRYESFGLTLAEGLSSGKPVVAPPVGLALLFPGSVNPIPHQADGPTMAKAVMNATVKPLSDDFLHRLSMERFGKEWADYLTGGKPPGLLSMAGNFAGSLAAHVADGGRKASPEVRAERERICVSNACGHCVDEGRGCTACGCGVNPALSFIGLDLALKRSWASSRCPLDTPLWAES